MRLATLCCLAALLSFGAPAQGQSLFNAAGMGVPLEALGGRARALGNHGIGLPGGAFLPTDPGALGRLSMTTGVMVAQPSWVDFSAGGPQTGSFQGTRFPLLGVAYPLAGGMMSFQVGSFLDQVFEASSTSSVNLASETVSAVDRFEQDGSVSNLNVGYARRVGEDLSVGVTVGRFAGSVDRTLTRRFDDGGVGDLDSYVVSGTWSYTGTVVNAGVSADLLESLRVAVSVQVPSDLDAEASDETAGGDRRFDVPVQYRAGASAQLGSGLIAVGSVVFADWSATQDDLLGSGRGGDANGFGLGVEFSRANLWGRDAPLRLGFRRTGLPFAFDDEGATERVFSGGFGLSLNTADDLVLAGVDFALERGRRTGTGITEDFWRATLSVTASGF